jgi:uncharacterized delta-60 repeat protein
MRLRFVALVVCVGCGNVKAVPDAAPPGGATLQLSPTSSWVPQGGTVSIGLSITRDADLTGPLTVRVNGLPAGVSGPDGTIAAGATTGTLAFSATTAATLASSTDVDVALLDVDRMLDHQPFHVFVSGAPGTLDTTYGTTGRATFPLPDPVTTGTGNGLARALAEYPSGAGANAGKLVIVAELDTTGTATTTRKYGIIRLNVDGTTDTTFGGGNGYVLITAGGPSDIFNPVGVAIDSQGRIAVAARRDVSGGGCDIVVDRVTASGATDTTFTPYDATPPGGGCGTTTSLAVIAGDKLVVLGTWNYPDSSQRPILVQLNSDGTVDSTAFASGFAVRFPNPGTTKPSWLAQRIVVDSMGRYLVSGVRCEGGVTVAYSACESAIGRITALGAWDTTWGTAGAGNLGYSALTFGTTSSTPVPQGFKGIAFDASGNVLVAGWSEDYATGTLARFLAATGAPDPSFGTSGGVAPTLVAGSTLQRLNDVALDAQGRVVAMGYAVSGNPHAVATRYSPSGIADNTFGAMGVTSAAADYLNTTGLLQLDDRILVVGATPRGSTGGDVAVWRFWP